MEQLTDTIGKRTWVQRWAGSYTLLSCSFWGPQYFVELEKELGCAFPLTLFIHRQGTVSFFVPKDDLDRVGLFLAAMVKNNPESLARLQRLKKNTSDILTIMDVLKGKIPSLRNFAIFKHFFGYHLPLHVFMKKTPDYLSVELVGSLLPQFVDARKESEPVYSASESFFRSLATAIGERTVYDRTNYDSSILTTLFEDELETFIATGQLPLAEQLQQRFAASALVFADGKRHVFLGEEAVQKIENALLGKINADFVTGVPAFSGVVSGRCRIVPDPFNAGDFREGDILVTGMTRPEFVPLMKKAAAIVTDAGGMLCHAALVAREMKKPCIVGTEKATKVFKDGDVLEVDAVEGTVKKRYS